jgi:formylglycine-generating enzyme required for sulfatase activity
VGNNSYAVAGSLKNAANDARLMSRTLRGLGFDVIEGLDLTRAQMADAFARFKRKLTPDSIAFFFYAGHGLQLGGRNYLVPTDFHVLCEGSAPDKALWDVGEALAEPAQKSSLTIVVLDACRSFSDVSKCVGKAEVGFTEFKNPPSGSFVAFSTSPGHVAADGQGANSFYTSALSSSLRMRPSRLEDVFIRTQIEVERATVGVQLSPTELGPQVPWTNSSLKTVFYFTADEVALMSPRDHAPPESPKSPLPDGASQFAFNVLRVNERGTQTGQVAGRATFYNEPRAALEMVQIPGGRFFMGAGADEAERAFAEAKRDGDNVDEETYQTITAEMPQHAVNVQGFFMSRYEVTQAQYAAVMGRLPNIEPGLRGPNMPVVNVTWHEASEFCARLSRQTGRLYRLPSEAEWEYAARAGTATPFAYGPTISPLLAVYNSAQPFGLAPRGPVRRAMTDVGALSPANAFGLHDMHGNVWEWCADYWHGGYDGAPTDGSTWEEPEAAPAAEESEDEDEGESGDRSRVARGGSWGSAANRCRSSSRFRYFPSTRSRYLGFRVAAAS